MSCLTFIEVHKQIIDSAGKRVPDANPTILNVTSLASVAKDDDHAVIELVRRDKRTFSSQAGSEKVNCANGVFRG